MPSMSQEVLAKTHRLSQEHRIEFINELPQPEWPDAHKETFRDIAKLGQIRYDSYATDPAVIEREPWKALAKKRAKLLTEKAERNLQRNESTWRYSCEHVIFDRLDADVACKNCRRRIWRSEIETSGDEPLSERQRRREPCRCPRDHRGQDYLEAVGLNRIFGHREDEKVKLEPAVAKNLGQDFKKPDRVFGLRQTRNIENLLYDTIKPCSGIGVEEEGMQLHELLDPSPLDSKGDKLLFPFLVLEAKSGTSDHDWHSIQMQTAFPIKAFLDTQERLRKATAHRSKWERGPVVWFFVCRGEDWRVYTAYLHLGRPRAGAIGDVDYRVVEVWRGSINTLSGALQLLLLVDYVFDFARDCYREEVIRELRILASGENDAASVMYTDTDIGSTRRYEIPETLGHDESEGTDMYKSRQEAFMKLDSKEGIVRHATFIESRYCCVLVTSDNVKTLLQSTAPNKTRRLCSLILHHMTESILLDLSTLGAMEQEWTGTSRLSPYSHLFGTKFHTVVSCTQYLSGQWHQVRELYVVALAEDAWDDVVEASKMKKTPQKPVRPEDGLGLDNTSIVRVISGLLSCSLRETILASILRMAVRIRPSRTHPNSATIVSDNGAFRDMVHYLYKSFKKGVLEPEEPFMRFSKRFDQHHLLKSDMEAVMLNGESLQVSEHGSVLVYSHHSRLHTDSSESEFCLYLVDDEPMVPSREKLFENLSHTIATRDVYHTTQNNGNSSLGAYPSMNRSWRVPWNLGNSYGVISHTSGFLDFLGELGKHVGNPHIPLTQGSLRTSAQSAQYLLQRNFYPCHDPQQMENPDMSRRRFIVYKLLTEEIKYWQAVANERRSRGVECCAACAEVAQTHENLCSTCLGPIVALGNLKVKHDDITRYDELFRDVILNDYGTILSYTPQSPGDRGTTPESEGYKSKIFEGRYYNLEEPFANLEDLHKQWYESRNPVAKRRGELFLSKKRRRDPEEDAIYEERRRIHAHSTVIQID